MYNQMKNPISSGAAIRAKADINTLLVFIESPLSPLPCPGRKVSLLVFFPEMPVSAFFLTTTLSVDLVCNEIYSRNLQYLDLPRLVRLPLFGEL